MSSKRTLTLAEAGFLALCAVWLLPGLLGHAPWKGGDGEQFVQFWLYWRDGAAPHALSPLYLWVARATAWLTAPFLPLHDGARLASGVCIALALVFAMRAGRALYGDEAGWPAAFVLLGCLGLLVRGHELNPYTAQFAAAAIQIHGLAALPRTPRAGWGLAAGGTLLVLAGGAAEAAALLLAGLALGFLSPAYRTPAVRRAFWLGAAATLVVAAAWVAALDAYRAVPWTHTLGVQRWAATPRPYFLGILGWFAWPAWPLAAWAVYRGRRQWREPATALPLAVLLALLALTAFAADPGEEQGLVLLLPLTLLGGAGLLSLRRGAANALLWFGVMLFGFLGLVLWTYWSAHDLGAPARLAARLGKLGMADVGSLRPWALALGVLVTLAWIVFLTRVQRSAVRPILVWTAGMGFVWALLMALFQGPLDRRLSYAELADALAHRVPARACVETYAVRTQAGLLLEYHSGRDLRPADAGCDWLLVQARRKSGFPAVAPEWIKQADIVRKGDRDDRFALYARR